MIRNNIVAAPFTPFQILQQHRTEQCDALQKFGTGFRVRNISPVVTLLITIAFLFGTLSPAFAASKGAAPVEWWPFDEGGGGTAYDQTSPYANATLTCGAGGTNTVAGQMWTRQGKLSGAIEFDGTDDYATATDSTCLKQGNSWSISAWVYPRASTGYDKMLVGKAGWHGGIILVNSILRFHISDSVGGGPSIDYNANLNTWYHCEATFETGTNAMKFYVNGALVGSATFSGTMLGYSNTLYIGGSSVNYMCNAMIDDVKIYNYVRDANQVLVDFNAGSAAYLGAGTDTNEGNPPVGYWPLDENTGTTAYDHSGSGLDGSLSGSSFWSPAKFGSGMKIPSGSTGTITVADNNLLDISNNISVDFWFYPISSTSGYAAHPLTKWTSTTDANVALYWFGNYGGVNPNLEDQFTFYANAGGSWTDVSVGYRTITKNRWYHVVWTYNSSSGSVLYIDGKSAGTSAGLGVLATNAAAFYIQKDSGDGAYIIDDVKIYNYVRTPGQVAWNYNHGKPVAHYKFDEGTGKIAHNDYSTADTGTAPVGWWRLDEGSSTTAADSSGNANTGTLAASPATPTWTASSKIGPNALSFDGTDDYVDVGVGTGTLNALGNTFTMEAWIKTPTPNARMTIFSTGYSGAGPMFGTSANTPGGLEIYYPGIYVAYTAGGLLSADTWYHVAYTRSGTGAGTHSFYINGAPQALSLDSANNFSDTNVNKYIGYRSGVMFNGLIDDVRVYNYARTPEQIYQDSKTTQGTLVGDTKFVDGKMNKALNFNGTTDYVTVSNPADNSLNPSSLSVSAWFKTSTTSGGWRKIVGKGPDATEVFGMYIKPSGAAAPPNTMRIERHINSTQGGLESNGPVVTDGNWHHCEYTYDGTTEKIYVDGILRNSASVSGAMTGSSENISIGAEKSSSTSTYFFDGSIDDVRIYSYARDAGQIQQDYADGAGRFGAPAAGEAFPFPRAGDTNTLPIGYWKLDDNTGVLARDASGNNNDGTLTNGPTWTQGKNGSALSFDGTDDYVIMPNSSSFNFGSGDFTVSWWEYRTSNDNGRTAIVRDTNNFYPGYLFGYSAAGANLLIYMNSAGSGWDIANGKSLGAVTLNTWNHFLVTRSGTTFIAYKNGAQTDTWTSSSAIRSGASGPQFGRYQSSSFYYYKGTLDDVRIYNYARTPAQIAWDYNAGKPVAHYRFNEGSGTTAYDEAKTNNGTITIGGTGSQTTIGAAWTNGATGKFGKALSLDGTDDYVTAGTAGIDKSKGTFSVWAKRADWHTGANGYNFFGTTTTGSTWQNVLEFQQYNNIVRFYWMIDSGGGTNYFYTSGDVTSWVNGTWHYIAGTWDSNSAKLYLDGALVSTDDTVTTPAAIGGSLRIGADGYASVGQFFNGLIDDVRIYNYVRTADQIRQDAIDGASARLGD